MWMNRCPANMITHRQQRWVGIFTIWRVGAESETPWRVRCNSVEAQTWRRCEVLVPGSLGGFQTVVLGTTKCVI
jgi:hypothetical protein